MLTCACALQVVGGCANVNSLPPVTFTIGGVGLDLQPQQWTRSVRTQRCLMSATPNSYLASADSLTLAL